LEIETSLSLAEQAEEEEEEERAAAGYEEEQQAQAGGARPAGAVAAAAAAAAVRERQPTGAWSAELAGTHLNLCAICLELRNHTVAAKHAQVWFVARTSSRNVNTRHTGSRCQSKGPRELTPHAVEWRAQAGLTLLRRGLGLSRQPLAAPDADEVAGWVLPTGKANECARGVSAPTCLARQPAVAGIGLCRTGKETDRRPRPPNGRERVRNLMIGYCNLGSCLQALGGGNAVKAAAANQRAMDIATRFFPSDDGIVREIGSRQAALRKAAAASGGVAAEATPLRRPPASGRARPRRRPLAEQQHSSRSDRTRHRARSFRPIQPKRPQPVRRPSRPFWRPFLTEIYLCNVCSCQVILRRNGRGQPPKPRPAFDFRSARIVCGVGGGGSQLRAARSGEGSRWDQQVGSARRAREGAGGYVHRPRHHRQPRRQRDNMHAALPRHVLPLPPLLAPRGTDDGGEVGDDSSMPWHLQPLLNATLGPRAALAARQEQSLLTTMELHMVLRSKEEEKAAAAAAAAAEAMEAKKRGAEAMEAMATAEAMEAPSSWGDQEEVTSGDDVAEVHGESLAQSSSSSSSSRHHEDDPLQADELHAALVMDLSVDAGGQMVPNSTQYIKFAEQFKDQIAMELGIEAAQVEVTAIEQR
jgi:hypothetical protein